MQVIQLLEVVKKTQQVVTFQLLEEGLIVAAAPSTQAVSVGADFIETPKPSKLAKYADMQDLLALDPIHEVDEEGWPEAPNA